MNISDIFLLFLIYSVIGWCLVVINGIFELKKFVNRGFLIGPYCPIYGVGALLVIWFLSGYLDRPMGLFVLSIVICSLVEYMASFLLEKVFNTRWWDYSNAKFNINGRICLETMIPFGIGCTLIMYVVNPFLVNVINSIPDYIINIMAIILMLILITDVIVSFIIIFKFKKISNDSRKDNTEKVTEYVKNEILKKQKLLYTRLIEAFPQLKILEKKGEKLWKKK